MTNPTIYILPGLDGTDLMLGPFQRCCAEQHQTIVGTIPNGTYSTYSQLADHFSEVVSQYSTCHIIAESFSGPIGILLAHRYPKIVTRLTLVASFATTPVPRLAAVLPWSILFMLPLPKFVAKYFFVGSNKQLVPSLQKAIGSNTSKILRQRLRLVQNVDVSRQFSELKCQVDYVRPRNDRLVHRRCFEKILKYNAEVKLIDIDGPHLILESCPEESWQAISGRPALFAGVSS